MNLRTPGPTPLPAEVREALGRDMVDHRGPEFTAALGEVTAGLRELHRTSNDLLVFTGSGTGGLEAAVVNLFSAGETVLVVSIGYFGERFATIARAFGLNVVKLDAGPGEAADPDQIARVLAQQPEISAVLVTHNETSTGTTNDLEAIARQVRAADRLLVVDGVSSVGSIPLETDAWGCDVVISGSQKSWMNAPGLSYVSVSARAWEAHARARLPRFYWDFTQARQWAEKGMTPWTPAVSLVFAQQAALRLMRAEGLDRILERHARLAALVRGRLQEIGLELVVRDPARASNTVTAFYLPPDREARAVQERLRAEFDVNLAGGQGALAGQVLRLGHLGFVHQPELEEALDAVRAVLSPVAISSRPA
jgi:aspartate aminotransferase-like enzyme